jgi:hypothetical protein
MAIDRHNCFADNCGVAAEQMLAAARKIAGNKQEYVDPADLDM